jgi:hypothetical protein
MAWRFWYENPEKNDFENLKVDGRIVVKVLLVSTLLL